MVYSTRFSRKHVAAMFFDKRYIEPTSDSAALHYIMTDALLEVCDPVLHAISP